MRRVGIRILAVLAVVVFLAALGASGCAKKVTTGKLMGAELFAQKCATCHGKGGKDNVPNSKAADPKDRKMPGFTTRDFAEEFNTDAKIRDIIEKGSKVEGAKGVKSMPAWKKKLTLAQIDSLVKYIDSLKP